MLLRAKALCPAARCAAGAVLRGLPAPVRALASEPVAVAAADVKALRARTGAPMMECRNALAAEGGDMERALDWLRKKGIAAASSKSGRTAAQGLVAAAVDAAGERAVLVEINSETDFVARNGVFTRLLSDAASAALASLPPVDAAAAAVSPTGAPPVPDEMLAAWAAAPSPPAATAGPTVAAAVVDAAARLRENVVLRRAARLDAPPGGLVVAYTHNAVAPGLGAVGVLLAVRPRGAAAAAPLAGPARVALAAAARRVAMHVAAARPAYLALPRVPTADVERERAIHAHAAAASGKPAQIVARMVDGRLSKWAAETVLVEQPFVLGDDGARVDAVLDAAARAAGIKAGAEVTGFAHFVVGESSAGSNSASPTSST